ncbi:MAG TPA: radical SAM protein [Desulfitobacteriaceae bacterium]|nr:radical SAM protein [Desulfitobacteriaceae bacterium]
MKIAFLAPAGAMHRYNGSFGKSLHYAPLTLTTLAALVPAELAAEVVIYDETAGSIPLDLEADLVCITSITGTSSRCYAYADYFRNKGKTVVLGGVHPTMLPEEAARHADVVFTGFAEQSFPQMLRDYQNGCLQPRYSQDCDFTINNRVLPRRELLNKKRYITMNSLEAVRGCSLPCTFCAYPAAFGRTIYKRPVKEIIAEIEALHSREVLFPDVNLIADRAFAVELFTAMIPLQKIWFGLVTSAIGIDDELVALFQKSGCRGLLIGFESISQSSQKFIHKGVNKVLEYEVLLKKLHDAGILVQGCFAFGGDDEDTSVFEKTVEMVIKTKIDLPRYSILTPFPQTEYFRQLESENRIVERDWAMYDVEHCVYIPRKMTKEELEDGIEWAWRETYKFSSILKRLAPFKNSPFLAFLVNSGYKGYADKFARFSRAVMTDNSDIPQVKSR